MKPDYENGGTTSSPTPDIWLDAITNSLNDTINSRIPPVELQDKLRQQVKGHREYLESLMDRAIRILYFIAAFIVAVAGILGFKPYWDIDDRLKKVPKNK